MYMLREECSMVSRAERADRYWVDQGDVICDIVGTRCESRW